MEIVSSREEKGEKEIAGFSEISYGAQIVA